MGATDFVRRNPIATKRVVRAMVRATDICAANPDWVARRLVDRGFTPRYESPIHSPYQEYLVKWNAIHMHFLKNLLWPVDDSIAVPSATGANMDLDSAKIEREENVRV
jgi:hypothetical protein